MNPLPVASISNIIGFLAVFMTLNAVLLYLFPPPFRNSNAMRMEREKCKQRRYHHPRTNNEK